MRILKMTIQLSASALVMTFVPSIHAQTIQSGAVLPTRSSAATPSVATAAPAPKPALPAAASAGCTDMQAAQAQMRDQIVKVVQDALHDGLKPALSYEGTHIDPRALTPRALARAKQEADTVSKAYFAALQNPGAAADAASNSISGDPSRRATMQMYARCADEDISARKIIDNTRIRIASSGLCASGAAPLDMSMNSTQVFQTSMAADNVMVKFARSKLTSTSGDAVTFCAPSTDDQTCRYGNDYVTLESQGAKASTFAPKVDRDQPYFIQDTTSFTSLPFVTPMVNRTALRIHQLNVCGTKVYLSTGFGNGGESGFDRSSLIGLIGTVGKKTLVIGDLSAQAWTPDSWPISFAQKYSQQTVDNVFGTSAEPGEYDTLAALMGSAERPVGGELDSSSSLGGRSRVSSARLTQ